MLQGTLRLDEGVYDLVFDPERDLKRNAAEALLRFAASGGCLALHDGDAEIAGGVTVHCIGGHSRGLQCVRIRTQAGWLVLASDAAHFYENVRARKPFPIVVDLQNMLDGFDTLNRLASHADLVIPGHDPLVRQAFPSDTAPHIFRLDVGPNRAIEI